MMLAEHKTMKDYFAAKAMQSLLIIHVNDGKIHNSIANEAYEIAEAMMKAREKKIL